MGGRGASIPGGGTVTLYHNTTPRAADSILEGGFRPTYAEGAAQDWYAESEGQYGFFTRRPGVGAAGYGTEIVAVTVPKSAVQRDPWSGHWRVPVSELRDREFRRYNPR